MNIRLSLIKILLKLLGLSYQKISEKKIKTWFWTSYPNQGFIDYITKRNIEISRVISSGVDRETYLSLLGQRIEVGMLLSEAKKAYQKIESDRQQKIEIIKKNNKK